jgi:hypothetical protein
MRYLLVLFVGCICLGGCGRDLTPEEAKVAAAQEKVAVIAELLADNDWLGFVEQALTPEDRALIQKDGSLEAYAETLAKKDLTGLVQIVEAMANAEALCYTAEGDDQVAFRLAEPIGTTEVVTMKNYDGDWFLFQIRKAK